MYIVYLSHTEKSYIFFALIIQKKPQTATTNSVFISNLNGSNEISERTKLSYDSAMLDPKYPIIIFKYLPFNCNIS